MPWAVNMLEKIDWVYPPIHTHMQKKIKEENSHSYFEIIPEDCDMTCEQYIFTIVA